VKIKVSKSGLKILLVGVLILSAIVFLAKGLFFAAFVNGTPITRLALIKELEKQNGKQMLESLITRELILQEAKKKGVVVKPQEVENEVKKIEKNTSKQGQNLDQLLAFQGMTRNDLKNQMQVQLILEKLLADKIKVSDKEIGDFIQKNTPEEQVGTQKPPTKDEARDQIRQQKIQKEASTLIEQLKKKAKISIFVNY